MKRNVGWGVFLVGALGALLGAQLAPEALFSAIERDLEALVVHLDALGQTAANGDWSAAAGALDALEELAAGRADDLADLDGQQAALLGAFLEGLAEAIAEHNAEDAVALSQAARGTVERLRRGFQAYLKVGTVVAVGSQDAAVGQDVEVVLFVQNLPREGLAAYAVRLRVDPSRLRLAAVEPVLGRGQVELDPTAGTARLSGFDAGGFFPNRLPPQAVALARVRLTVRRPGLAAVEVQVEELLDGQARRIVALDLDGEVRAP